MEKERFWVCSVCDKSVYHEGPRNWPWFWGDKKLSEEFPEGKRVGVSDGGWHHVDNPNGTFPGLEIEPGLCEGAVPVWKGKGSPDFPLYDGRPEGLLDRPSRYGWVRGGRR